MVRDSGLGHVQFFHDLADREPVATDQPHDLLAGLIGDGFGEKERVYFHRRLSMQDYIEVCLFVKRSIPRKIIPANIENSLVKFPITSHKKLLKGKIQPKVTRLRTQVLAFTFTRLVLNTMHRMVYPFLPAFSRGLGVDLQAVSLAVMARSALGATGPFLAFIADHRGRKAGMLTGLALFCLGAAIVFLWPTFPGFVLTLILTMLGKYVFDPSMQAYLGDRVPYERRGLILAATELGWSLSFILGIPLAGFLIARQGWRSPFPPLALLGLLALGSLNWILPKDPAPSENHASKWHNIQSVLSYKPALVSLVMSLLMMAANEVVNLVFGVWMEDAFNLKIVALGAASAVIGLSELGGETLSARLTDRLGKTRAVGAGIISNSMAALILPILGYSLPGAMIGLFLFYITFEFTVVSAIPLMTEIMPQARATLMATSVAGASLGRAFGALIATPLYSSGILGSGLAAGLLNLLSLLALIHLRRMLLAQNREV